MQRDITKGVEWKQILLFSLPILLGNLLQQLYNTVDGIVVGNYVSETALAAVGSGAEVAVIFIAFAIGMSSGSSIMISQFFGARQYDKLRRAVSTTLIILVSMGAVALLISVIGARWLLAGVLNVHDQSVLEPALVYFRIYALGLVFQFTYNCIAAMLRAVGDSRATLYFLIVSVVLNLVLDLVFVIVFRWGVAGAAAATVIAQGVCVLVSIIYMQKKYEVLRLDFRHLCFDKELAHISLSLGIPTTLQQCVLSFGHIFTQRLVNHFGQATMSGYFVGNRLMSYVFLPCSAFNVGMATFTGQNVGAGEFDRVRRGLRGIIVIGVGLSLIMAAIVFSFATPIVKLFGVESEALHIGVTFLRGVAFFVPMMAIYMPITGVLQGSGDVLWSTACTFTCFAVRIIAAYLMVYAFGMQQEALHLCMPVSWILTVLVGGARYFSGKWKTKAIAKRSQEAENA